MFGMDKMDKDGTFQILPGLDPQSVPLHTTPGMMLFESPHDTSQQPIGHISKVIASSLELSYR